MIFVLNTVILFLTLISPFVEVYAVKFVKNGELAKHAKIQKTLFLVCMTALVVLEMQIRVAGGSGSIVKHSEYYGTPIFKGILIAHIIGAVLTYLIWAILVLISSFKFRKKHRFEGNFGKTHKKLGMITIIGLFYTAITALIVYLLTFIL
ncbi:MAG: DUF420 domain-containing protein [Crocinitomicaceae bacterium]|nr:DUF420 domain-containing protein [Crocinitomicaceae bacterium]